MINEPKGNKIFKKKKIKNVPVKFSIEFAEYQKIDNFLFNIYGLCCNSLIVFHYPKWPIPEEKRDPPEPLTIFKLHEPQKPYIPFIEKAFEKRNILDAYIFGELEFIVFLFYDFELFTHSIGLYKVSKHKKQIEKIHEYVDYPVFEDIPEIINIEGEYYAVFKKDDIKFIIKSIKQIDEFNVEYDIEILNGKKDRKLESIFLTNCDDFTLSYKLQEMIPSLSLKDTLKALKKVRESSYKAMKYFVLPEIYIRLKQLNANTDLIKEVEHEILTLQEESEEEELSQKLKRWKAKALRKIGEYILKAENDSQKALTIFYKAIDLDTNVGVKRLIKKLEKKRL